MILVSWPLAFLIWIKVSAAAGMFLAFAAFLLSLIGWPFAGVLLHLILVKRPRTERGPHLWISIFLWLLIGFCFAYLLFFHP